MTEVLRKAVKNALRFESGIQYPKEGKCLKAFGVLWKPSQFSGIYFLFNGDQLIYIGQTKSALRRMSSHQSSKGFDSIVFVSIDNNLLDDVERALVCGFKPPLNRVLLTGDWSKEAALAVLHEAWRRSGRKQAVVI